MKLRVLLGLFVFAGAGTLVATRVLSQEEGDKGGPRDAMMEAWMKAATPGEFHAHLNPLAGKWSQEVKWWMAPGIPPQVSTGTSEYEWIMGGRYLLSKVRGDMAGQPFEGLGILGYDNYKKKYTSVWLDNMGTMIMTSLGTCDESGKVINMAGTFDDVGTGKPNQKFRTICRVISNDKNVFEMYMPAPDGTEFKTLEITYTRR